MHWGRIHRVKDLPWLVRGQLFDGFGILFFWGLLTILSASEDNRSLMGGSDVVHCVWVPLTGTIVAEFLACGSLVGDWFMYNYLLCVQYRGHWGPSMIVL